MRFVLAATMIFLLDQGAAAYANDTVGVRLGHSDATLAGPWRFQIGDNAAWATPQFDDSHWQSMDLLAEPGAHDADVGLSGYVPGWYSRGFKGHEGYAWYRMRVHIDTAPDTRLALLAPTQVDDAYQIYWNGMLIGASGDWSGMEPVARSVKPRLIGLPDSAVGADSVIAVRVWMQPGLARDNDAGGMHSTPKLGTWDALTATHQLQWFETIRGYVVDVIEPLAFLLLAVFSLMTVRSQPSPKFAVWLAAALTVTALQRLNQAVYFWLDIEDQDQFLLAKYVLLEPLSLIAWLLAWCHWFRAPTSRAWMSCIVLAAMIAMTGTMLDVAPWLRSIFRLCVAAAMLGIAMRPMRRFVKDRRLAQLCVLLVAIGLFAEELWAIGVPGIWFPFGVGVSRTQLSYAVLCIALGALLLRPLMRAASLGTALESRPASMPAETALTMPPLLRSPIALPQGMDCTRKTETLNSDKKRRKLL